MSRSPFFYARDTETSRRRKMENLRLGGHRQYFANSPKSSPQKNMFIGFNKESEESLLENMKSSKNHSMSGDKRKTNPFFMVIYFIGL